MTGIIYCVTFNHITNVLKTEKQIVVISVLAEGSSIRSIERMTGISRNTIMNLGETIWDGEVEVFDLADHPETDRVYAWGYVDDNDQQQHVTVLHIPPATSPENAVRASIISDYRNEQGN